MEFVFECVVEIDVEVLSCYGYGYEVLFVVIKLKFIFRFVLLKVLEWFGFCFVGDKMDCVIFLFDVFEVMVVVIEVYVNFKFLYEYDWEFCIVWVYERLVCFKKMGFEDSVLLCLS